MSLTTGTRIGVFEVTGSLGAGGMGEVYRARDTTLHRDVALKILPEGFAEEPERLARFRQEAQVLASLNHPHIAAIHGLEETPSTGSGQAGIKALVLELVEGPTLADRIAQGPIPLDESLTIARQITEALEAAHEAGVIHRDLKPANIKLREDGGRTVVKVLDFGLAKPAGPVRDLSPSALSASPTLTTPAQTVQGVILGTAAYMSPEQAKGKPVDAQTDIWAFGCVLFEMLSGQRLFGGDSVTESLGAVLHKAPDWEALPKATPPHVRVALERCLARDPRERLHDIADVRFALDGVFETATDQSSAPPADIKRLGAIGTAAVLVGALLAGTAVWALKPVPSVETGVLTRTVITTPPEFPVESNRAGVTPFFSRLAISPDGERIVYASGEPDAELDDYRLVVRDLDSFEVRELPGTETALGPEFSPDGTSIVFWHRTDRAIKRVSVLGGTPTTLVTRDDLQVAAGFGWTSDDTITFGASGVWRVPADGGEPEQLLASGRFPLALPDGRGVVFLELPGDGSVDVRVRSSGTGEISTLWSSSNANGLGTLLYSPTGHLLYVLDETVWARPFDVETLTVTGEAVPLIDGVRSSPMGGEADLAVSRTGSLVYGTAPPLTQEGEVLFKTLVWVDRNGDEAPLPFEPQNYIWPALSSDGRRLAVAIQPVQDVPGARPAFADLGSGPDARLTVSARDRRWAARLEPGRLASLLS